MYSDKDKKLFYDECRKLFLDACNVTSIDVGFWELSKNIPLHRATNDIDIDMPMFCYDIEKMFGIKISPDKIQNCCTIAEVAATLMKEYKPDITAYRNAINSKKTTPKQPNPCSELRDYKHGKAFCKLLGHQCNRVDYRSINPNANNYCEYINCLLYKNFQKLR